MILRWRILLLVIDKTLATFSWNTVKYWYFLNINVFFFNDIFRRKKVSENNDNIKLNAQTRQVHRNLNKFPKQMMIWFATLDFRMTTFKSPRSLMFPTFLWPLSHKYLLNVNRDLLFQDSLFSLISLAASTLHLSGTKEMQNRIFLVWNISSR